MKAIISTLILIVFNLFINAQQIDFDFYNSSGNMYNSLTFNKQINNEYGSVFNERIILLQTKSLKDSSYLKQIEVLEKLDAEMLETIFVTACSEESNSNGYYTRKETALQLMSNSKKFKVRILDSTGKLITESDKPLSEKKIKMILNE